MRWEEGGRASARLQLVHGGASTMPAVATVSPTVFQDSCLEAFRTSQAVRSFAQTSIENNAGVLDRFLAACGKPAWEVTAQDVDRVMASLIEQGLTASTRRGYLQVFKSFHAFLSVRKAVEIRAVFGVQLVDPLDDFNVIHHVDSSSPSAVAPPSDERMEEFFDFLKHRIAGARKYAVAGRDYALFRTLYLAGTRAEETSSLDRADVHFGRGPFGKIHVRFGKGAKTSGPRPRWVPMLDGLDLILRWYLEEIAPLLGDGPPCFRLKAEAESAAVRSATGWNSCYNSNKRPAVRQIRCRPTWLISAPTPCAMPAPPATTSAALTSWPSNKCSAIGMSGPRCAT